jgi:alkaline phosphatase
MLFDQMAFEDAVKVAIEFALEDGETLVIVTSDHATGGPSLNGAGDEYWDSTAGMVSILNAKASFDRVVPQLRSNATVAGVKDVIKANYGFEIKDAEAEAILASLADKHPLMLSEFTRSANMTLSEVLGNYSKIRFTSQNHTSDHVLVTAVGPGSEQCGGVTENVKFFDMMLAAKGLAWSNPTMTLEEAMRHRDKLSQMFARDRELFAYGDEPVEHFI